MTTLTITARDTSGTLLAGIGVDVYVVDGSIISGVTDGNGVFVLDSSQIVQGAANYVFVEGNFFVIWTGEYDESVTYVPQPIPPPSVVGTINAIRVRDVVRALWFSWDNGFWDANGSPSVTSGVGNLYIAFNAVNTGGSAGNLTLTITNSSGTVLATVTRYTTIGGNAGIEWTGNMPSASYGITLSVTP